MAYDEGINRRDCLFARTCWVLFLCFPLDYQNEEYITQAVNQFGTVVTWTNNENFKSRVLLKCLVLHISRIPISVVVCKPAVAGAGGQSWTVPVFILNSKNNDHIPEDEDPVPDDGNPHPFPGANLNQHQLDLLENEQDLHDIEQANEIEGWVPPLMPNVAAAAANIQNDWPVWPQQEEEVDQNELEQVQNLANEFVFQSMMQNQNSQQTTQSVSSETQSIFRAQVLQSD